MSLILPTTKHDQSSDGDGGDTPCPASPPSECDGFQYLDARAFAGEESTAGSTTDWNLQSSHPGATSHPPRTPPRRRMSWAFRRNHGDPFFGAKEAKASPVAVLCDKRPPPATSGAMVHPMAPVTTGLVPDTELSEQHQSPLAKRIIKRIPRILFPSSHQRPRSTSNARHMTELRSYEYVSCCAGCYGSGLICDKREKGMCSQCEREDKPSCNWITLAEQRERDRW